MLSRWSQQTAVPGVLMRQVRSIPGVTKDTQLKPQVKTWKRRASHLHDKRPRPGAGPGSASLCWTRDALVCFVLCFFFFNRLELVMYMFYASAA